ncbi:MAG: FG-GAP-like repeat-containing protein, partial [Promethearchaeota archaeon]
MKKKIIVLSLMFCIFLFPIYQIPYSSYKINTQNNTSKRFQDNPSEKMKLSASASEMWSYTTSFSVFFNPAIGDLDLDGNPEVLILSGNPPVFYILDSGGSLIWSHATDNAFSPLLEDVDGDGKLEFIMGDNDGYIKAFNGEDRTELWRSSGFGNTWSDPALGDIDNDGKLEIVFGASDPNIVSAINAEDGTELWTYSTGSDYHIRSSVALGDIDNDGKLEA